jgi:hypothetical protein
MGSWVILSGIDEQERNSRERRPDLARADKGSGSKANQPGPKEEQTTPLRNITSKITPPPQGKKKERARERGKREQER